MHQWQLSLRRGRRLLSRHKPESALRCFEEALADCPVERERELSTVLFYLGMTLVKVGMISCALKSWAAAEKVRRRGYAVEFLRRFSTECGMARQKDVSIDDWKTFYSLHLERYLRTKHSHRLGTDAEGDMIRDLIHDAWKDLLASTEITDLTAAEKVALFRQVKIVFPAFRVPRGSEGLRTIMVDFNSKRKMFHEDRCSCGSGLSYEMCCGRAVVGNGGTSGLK